MVTLLHCPLCAWAYRMVETRETAGLRPEIILSAETALRLHCLTHPLTDWVRAVTRLQSELANLKATFP